MFLEHGLVMFREHGFAPEFRRPLSPPLRLFCGSYLILS